MRLIRLTKYVSGTYFFINLLEPTFRWFKFIVVDAAILAVIVCVRACVRACVRERERERETVLELAYVRVVFKQK